jgi:hypothetical protein
MISISCALRHGGLTMWRSLKRDKRAFTAEVVGIVTDASVNLLRFHRATVSHTVQPSSVDLAGDVRCPHHAHWRVLKHSSHRSVQCELLCRSLATHAAKVRVKGQESLVGAYAPLIFGAGRF